MGRSLKITVKITLANSGQDCTGLLTSCWQFDLLIQYRTCNESTLLHIIWALMLNKISVLPTTIIYH